MYSPRNADGRNLRCHQDLTEEKAYKDLQVHQGSVCKDNPEEMDSKEKTENEEQQVSKVMRELPENLDCPEEMAYLETKAKLV